MTVFRTFSSNIGTKVAIENNIFYRKCVMDEESLFCFFLLFKKYFCNDVLFTILKKIAVGLKKKFDANYYTENEEE